MRVLRASSLEEYARWYLRRDQLKKNIQIPDNPDDPVKMMRHGHSGKMRDWFSNTTARWSIVSLDALNDFANLLFLERDWTKQEGLVTPDGKDYRILGRVAANAIAGNFLERPMKDKRCRVYYDRLATGSLQLRGDDRLAICSATDDEIRDNPSAQYYLLDGSGRGLAYMILLAEQKNDFAAIEAFWAER